MSDADQSRPAMLCVDDEPSVLRAITRVFRTEPITILTASNGAEGLSVLRQNPVRIIMTDYRMPGMTGVQFLEQAGAVRSDAFRILLTGYADVGAVSEAVNRGHVHKILYKPWNDDAMRLAVRSALDHYAKNEENHRLIEELAVRNEQLMALNKLLERKLGTGGGPSATLPERLLAEFPDGIVLLDRQGRILYANKAAMSGLLDGSGGYPYASALPPGPVADLARAVLAAPSADSAAETDASATAGRRCRVRCRRLTLPGARDDQEPSEYLLLHIDTL
jgi:FixJ family two-component response regulator